MPVPSPPRAPAKTIAPFGTSVTWQGNTCQTADSGLISQAILGRNSRHKTSFNFDAQDSATAMNKQTLVRSSTRPSLYKQRLLVFMWKGCTTCPARRTSLHKNVRRPLPGMRGVTASLALLHLLQSKCSRLQLKIEKAHRPQNG